MSSIQAGSVRVGQTVYVAGVGQTVRSVRRGWRSVRIRLEYTHSAFDGQAIQSMIAVRRTDTLLVAA